MSEPKIDEKAIKRICTGESFRRGKEYYEQNAVVEPVREGDVLRGLCWGTAPEPYEVKVTLGENEVLSFECTCPYDWGGACKHVVALLLTYIHQPEAFEVIDREQEEKQLMALSKEQLISLIQKMVAEVPKLRPLIQLHLETSQEKANERKQKPEIDFEAELKKHRRAADSIFRGAMYYDYYWAATGVGKELSGRVKGAQKLAEQGEALRALALLTATFESIDDNYETIDDSDGVVADVASECVEAMRKIVREVDWDAETRQAWQKRMFQRFVANDYGLADEFGELLLDSCRPEDVGLLAMLAQDELKRLQSPKADEFPVHYRQKVVLRFLSALHKHAGDADKGLAILREHGLHLDYAKALIQDDRLEEALDYAKEFLQGQDAVEFANWLLNEANKPNETIEFLEFVLANKARTVSWSSAMRLLAEAKELLGDVKGARDALMELYSRRADLSVLKNIHRLSQSLGDWGKVREQALSEIGKQSIELPELISIYLFLGEWDKAIWEAQQLTERKLHTYLPIYLLVEEVAKTVAPHRPKEAISLFQFAAESHIDKGNREAYRRAASLLKEAKRLAEQVEPAAFQRYIDALRERYPKRRALLEELKEL